MLPPISLYGGFCDFAPSSVFALNRALSRFATPHGPCMGAFDGARDTTCPADYHVSRVDQLNAEPER